MLLLSLSGCPNDGTTSRTLPATIDDDSSGESPTDASPTTTAPTSGSEDTSTGPTPSTTNEMGSTSEPDASSTGPTQAATSAATTTDTDTTGTTAEPIFCGDGVIAGIEECDDMGESPTCDPDCTLVKCGDTLTNLSAGETCDDGDDTAFCDADCTKVECGDGHANPVAGEQCDDGNLLPEDDCSPVCLATSVRLAVGRTHVCALDASGSAHCWGNGDVGQLGQGNPDNLGDQPGELPIAGVNVGGPIQQIALGYHHTCAVQPNDKLRCWGGNEDGALGLGNTNHLGDQPGELPSADILVGAGVHKVAAGNSHTCAIVDGGKVRCWGINADGQLGYGNTTKLLAPSGVDVPGIADAQQIVAGAVHNCVLLADHSVHCWGHGAYGQLGLGDNQSIGDNPGETPVMATPVSDASDPVVQLSAGWVHTCAILESGKVRCWGWNPTGQCGADFGNERIGDAPGELPPPDVDLGGPAVQVAAGLGHTCALMRDGTVKCWGDVLVHGHPDTGPIDSAGEFPPPNVEVGGDAVSIAAHLASFTCVLLADQKLRCWGENNWGQLGIGSTEPIGDNETPAVAPTVPL